MGVRQIDDFEVIASDHKETERRTWVARKHCILVRDPDIAEGVASKRRNRTAIME